MKDNKNILLLLLLLGGGYALYSYKKKKSLVNEKGNDATDWSQTPNSFDPVAYAKKNSQFKQLVAELQERLNIVLAEMNKSLIKVDGFIGQQTEWAIGQVFGTESLPILNPKQVQQYNDRLLNRESNEQMSI